MFLIEHVKKDWQLITFGFISVHTAFQLFWNKGCNKVSGVFSLMSLILGDFCLNVASS